MILRQGDVSGRPRGSTNIDNSLTSIFLASQQCISSAPCSIRFPDRPIEIATTSLRDSSLACGGDLQRGWHLPVPSQHPYDVYDRSTCDHTKGRKVEVSKPGPTRFVPRACPRVEGIRSASSILDSVIGQSCVRIGRSSFRRVPEPMCHRQGLSSTGEGPMASAGVR